MSTPTSARPNGKRIQLMATCLCDAFYDDVAAATVEVLEHLGCEIDFPEDYRRALREVLPAIEATEATEASESDATECTEYTEYTDKKRASDAA